MFSSAKIVVPLLLGLLFVASYFLSGKGAFFRFLAYFPRERDGSRRIGAIVFGSAFILVAIYNLLAELFK